MPNLDDVAVSVARKTATQTKHNRHGIPVAEEDAYTETELLYQKLMLQLEHCESDTELDAVVAQIKVLEESLSTQQEVIA